MGASLKSSEEHGRMSACGSRLVSGNSLACPQHLRSHISNPKGTSDRDGETQFRLSNSLLPTVLRMFQTSINCVPKVILLPKDAPNGFKAMEFTRTVCSSWSLSAVALTHPSTFLRRDKHTVYMRPHPGQPSHLAPATTQARIGQSSEQLRV